MSFKCHDIFMVRTPTLPLYITKNLYGKDYKGIWEYICSLNLDTYFLEAIIISSPTLYSSVKKLGKYPKNDDATYISLYKYLVRASARTTPYGLFANIALGEFRDTEKPIIRNKKIGKRLYADSSWIFNLIYKLEKLYLSKLCLCWNKSCYLSNNRVKNPIFSNHNISVLKVNTECSIRNTNLINIIRDATVNFIKYDDLVLLIKNEYPTSSEEQISSVIQKLVEEEFLFTELRIPNYCDNYILHIVRILNREKILYDLQDSLMQIQESLDRYNDVEDGELYIKKIIELMKNHVESNAYVAMDTNLMLKNEYLNIHIKERLERFIKCVSRIAIDSTVFSPLNKLKEHFMEEYGINIKVPIIEVIDPSRFNGLAFYDESRNNGLNSREENIKNIFETKVQAAILNGDRAIKVYEEDFSGIDKLSETFVDSFDLNIIITKDKNDIKLSLGPNLGATSAGKSFKRFSKILNNELYDKYKRIYELTGKNDENVIELREYSSVGRTVNLINQDRSFLKHLSIGMPDAKDESLKLKDLSIQMNDRRDLLLYDINKNIKYKLSVDNMVNPLLNSKVFNLLKEISEDSIKGRLIERFDSLLLNEYIYTPAIYIEDVQVSPEKWCIKNIPENLLNLEEFKNYFKNFTELYRVPEYFYLCRDDNRLPLHLGDKITDKILYLEFKKTGYLTLCAIEDGFFSDGVLYDNDGDFYASEFIFSFYQDINSADFMESSINIDEKSSLIQNNNRVIMPFQLGWLYFKIYCNKEIEDDFLIAFKMKSKELMINEFFFVRYDDETGRHIRLRIKFPTQEDAIKQYSKISDWFLDIKKNDFINSWSIHAYHRECNRYGGEFFIRNIEKIFCENSNLIIKKISENNMNDNDIVESVYLSEVGTFLYTLSRHDKMKMLNILDEITERHNYRKEYKKNRKRYMRELDKALNIVQYDDFIDNTMLELERWRTLLTTNMNEIILSLIHMCCNRIKGDRALEEKTYSILRHALFDIISREKNYSK